MSNKNMQKITQNGFYKSSDFLEFETIKIEDNLKVAFFDNGENIKKIILGKNSFLEYFSFFEGNKILEKNIVCAGENSKAEIKSFLISGEGQKLKAKISGEIKASYSKIDSKIISIAKNNGNIDLDGIIDIKSGVEKVEGYLKEENIFLGDEAQITGIPTLLVASSDVKANHSCSIEKISDSKLFYLRSRGIGKENALQMMIEGYIFDLFKCLSMIDCDFYENLVLEIKNNII